MEVVMIEKIAPALAAAFVLASAVTASAQPAVHGRAPAFAPAIHGYESELLPRSDHQNCYLPSQACDNEHTVTN
jgi:hypothetical protein